MDGDLGSKKLRSMQKGKFSYGQQGFALGSGYLNDRLQLRRFFVCFFFQLDPVRISSPAQTSRHLWQEDGDSRNAKPKASCTLSDGQQGSLPLVLKQPLTVNMLMMH